MLANSDFLVAVDKLLSNSNLPVSLKQRLMHDMQDSSHFNRLNHVANLVQRAPNTSWGGYTSACLFGHKACLVDTGMVGLLKENENFEFLAPGYHSLPFMGVEFIDTVPLNTINKPVINGSAGFVTISEGNIGVMTVGAQYRLLAPGTYQWNNPAVRFESAVSICTSSAQLGPFTLVTVPEGMVAATYNNGQLRMLGHNESGSRTYFLDDPKWVFGAFLSTSNQTDRLEGNDLLSKDNVELLMVAMSQWRISDPVAAVTHCAPTMQEIRLKVNQLVRAAIARIVAGTNIGAGPVSGSMARPVVGAKVVTEGIPVPRQPPGEEVDLSHLMQSTVAVKHMAELSANMAQMGIEVVGVFVPEKRMKNDDIREQVAKQAVIGIRADAERAAADAKAYATVAAARAEAEAKRQTAEADAFAKVTAARAEAESIAIVTSAQAKAGELLGNSDSTAARIALTGATASALSNAKVTIFSGAPSHIPFMLTNS